MVHPKVPKKSTIKGKSFDWNTDIGPKEKTLDELADMEPVSASVTPKKKIIKVGGKNKGNTKPVIVTIGPKSKTKVPAGTLKKNTSSAKTLNTLMPMTDAYHLYQAVQGTSAGSRYFVVASAKNYVVSSRCINAKVSIRFESRTTAKVGPMANVKWRNACTQAGLVPAGGNTEAHVVYSMHLHVETLALAQRAIGSVIMGLGLTFDTGLPIISEIWNKGH